MAAGKFTTTPSPIEVVEKVNAVIDDVAGKLSASGTAAKATADASGNTITSTYETKANAITGLSVSGRVITYTKGNGSTGTITTQDTAGGYHTGNATYIGGASATTPAVVVTSYKSGASWYRVWSDGWIEQGGVISGTSGNQNNQNNYQTVTLYIPFNDANYTVAFSLNIAGIATAIDTFTQIWSKAYNYFQVRLCDTGNTNSLTYTWYACGQGA